MTYIELLKKIDSLAPLPKTLMNVEEFKRTDNYDTNELAKIIEDDPLMVSTILKTANSAMFGFVAKIDTLDRAVSLLGINFTISIALGSGIKRALNSELNAYGVSSDEFLRIANIQSNFVSLWIGDMELKKELILPAFLQESGKFLINTAIVESGRVNEFTKEIQEKFDDIASVEKEFLGISGAEVTATIFKHWNIAPNIVNIIKYTDEIAKALPRFEQQTKILHIAKLVGNISKPLDDKCLVDARQKVEEFGLDVERFDKAVAKMQARLLEE